ncbi:hypothetical protein CAPTEDRAFT_218270 [Capitella teleta]|uniref:Protein kinase domain-containing protein n=1 Tax=Capitella teleta TaxID=283909 RepID=R7VB77_CAPTE|nr:hypothetical protein CAPTEDRAFT_218270 [Capitella teleta]|eukprot:ELU13571.1 hypothetical protein CAPTEDRAFT_218270 [Capitella teleta]
MDLLAFRYKFVDIIGQGQSSVFIKAMDTFRDNSLVSIKVLHSQNNALGAQEAECLRKLNQADPEGYSATLRLFTKFTLDEHYCMVFELLNPCQLNKYFDNLPRDETRLPSVRKVALYLLQALGFLQRQNVIHADLKPENILLQNENFESLKVVDFGNAIQCVHEELSLYYGDFELQTLLYRAPEVMFGLHFGLEVDLWSLGCILAELYSGSPLFYGKDKESIMTKMVDLLGPMPYNVCKRGKFYSELEHFSGSSSQSDGTGAISRYQQKT